MATQSSTEGPPAQEMSQDMKLLMHNLETAALARKNRKKANQELESSNDFEQRVRKYAARSQGAAYASMPTVPSSSHVQKAPLSKAKIFFMMGMMLTIAIIAVVMVSKWRVMKGQEIRYRGPIFVHREVSPRLVALLRRDDHTPKMLMSFEFRFDVLMIGWFNSICNDMDGIDQCAKKLIKELKTRRVIEMSIFDPRPIEKPVGRVAKFLKWWCSYFKRRAC